MAGIDMVKMAKVANSLVVANGRVVHFIKHNTTPADGEKPWNGPADARAAPLQDYPATAVFCEPHSLVSLGITTKDSDLFKKSTQIAICAPNDEANQLETFDEVLDEDGQYWRITAVEKLRPASRTLCYFVGVAR